MEIKTWQESTDFTGCDESVRPFVSMGAMQVEINQLRAALAVAPSVPVATVPTGWKLVPIEPTPDMLAVITTEADQLYPDAEAAYNDLLSAAPSPEGEVK